MGAGDDELVDVVGGERGGGEGPLPGLAHERPVGDLAEALLPRAGAFAPGDAPALEELLGRDAGTEVLGDHRTVGVVAEEDRSSAVAAGGFVGGRGETTTLIGGDHERRHAGREGRAQRTRTGAQRTTEVERTDVGRQPQGGVHGGGVGLLEIGG